MAVTATLDRQIKEAELRQKQAEIQSKESSDAVAKITALRMLLVDTIVEGTESTLAWRSILCASDAEVVTKKLIELVKKL